VGTRARTCTIDTAAADAIERMRNSIDAPRLVAAAAVAIMTPSKRLSATIHLVGFARIAGPSAHVGLVRVHGLEVGL